MDKKYLIKGGYDMHLHPGPDVMPRIIDDVDCAKQCVEFGMAGFAIKSHYYCTAERAYYANKLVPKCKTIGTITLNNSVGGINPVAVEMAGRSGAKIIWFPTFDGKCESDFLYGSGRTDIIYPSWAIMIKELEAAGVESPQIYVVDKDGKLLKEVYDIIDIAKKYNMIIATSHMSHEETFALAKACKEKNHDKLIITHVTYPNTTYTVEEQKELLKYGGIMEYSYSTITTGKTTLEKTIEGIRGIGYQNCLISSDMGTPRYKDTPCEGLLHFAEVLFDNGFSEEEIQYMCRINPEKLLKD